MQRDYPNNKVVLVTEAGEYESASEDEYDEHAVDLAKLEYAQDEDREVVPLYCDAPNVPLLVCAPKILSVQPMKDEEQRCNLFQTRALVGTEGKGCKVIIDGGSYQNLASKELCTKLGLRYYPHPHPYHVQWLSNQGEVKVNYKVKVTFQIGLYCDTGV